MLKLIPQSSSSNTVMPRYGIACGVPYVAGVAAYDVLTRLLDHQYLWSTELGC